MVRVAAELADVRLDPLERKLLQSTKRERVSRCKRRASFETREEEDEDEEQEQEEEVREETHLIKKPCVQCPIGDHLAPGEETEGAEAVLDRDEDDLVADVLEELLELDLRVTKSVPCAQGQS